jgi:7-cyano-7-deazaguanine reductase
MKPSQVPEAEAGSARRERQAAAHPAAPAARPALDLRPVAASAVRPDLLDTFAYEYPGSPAVVEIATDEFTAVCPWSGLPDFGTVTVRYLPRARILELRSFKYYLLSYRNVGIYQEHAANRMLQDLTAACGPQWMELTLDYRVRGGVHTIVRARWPDAAG